jgi:hypothetical protein
VGQQFAPVWFGEAGEIRAVHCHSLGANHAAIMPATGTRDATHMAGTNPSTKDAGDPRPLLAANEA